MITLERYSQRDSRWSQQKLGTSTLTIGDYGCAITCIAMMARVRPDKVNNIMVSSGAFHQNALVKWAPVSGLFGLSFQSQGRYYPRIAEVGGLSGFAQHFVLVMNKDILWDPWDGKEKTWGNSGYSFKSWRHLRIIEKVRPLPRNLYKSLIRMFDKMRKIITEHPKINGNICLFIIYLGIINIGICLLLEC